MNQKPTYKITAKILEAWLYYMDNPIQANLDSIISKMMNTEVLTLWVERSIEFNKQVLEGKHGKISDLIIPLKKNVYSKPALIEFDNYNVILSDRLYAVDTDNGRIYAVKRVDEFKQEKYTKSINHIVSLFLNKDALAYYYIIVSGYRNVITEHHVVPFIRPSEEELYIKVKDTIEKFVSFMQQDKLLWKDFVHFLSVEETSVPDKQGEN